MMHYKMQNGLGHYLCYGRNHTVHISGLVLQPYRSECQRDSMQVIMRIVVGRLRYCSDLGTRNDHLVVLMIKIWPTDIEK